MKIINLYKRFVCRVWCLLTLPMLLCSCFYEHPELTAEGEKGIDPTSVTLNTNLTLHFKMPALESGKEPIDNPVGEAETPQYRHRFIVEAYLDRVFVARQVVYRDVVKDGSEGITVPVSMKLHARFYEIAVWADYVPLPDEEDGLNGAEDYFYNTTSGHFASIYNSGTYHGNNEYKDAFCGSTEVDLEDFRDQWGGQKMLDVELKRPVARLQFTANDVAGFLKQHGDAAGKTLSFVARLRYNNYLDVGYNVLERLPRHGLLYLQCDRTFKTDQLTAGEPFPLVFDYVFAPDEKNVSIPVTLEILDSTKEKVLASTSFNVFGRAGFYTDVTYGFLTADPDGGIIFDPSFDGESEIEVPVHPQK